MVSHLWCQGVAAYSSLKLMLLLSVCGEQGKLGKGVASLLSHLFLFTCSPVTTCREPLIPDLRHGCAEVCRGWEESKGN